MTAIAYFHDLNPQYLALHRTKEDFFWETTWASAMITQAQLKHKLSGRTF